MSVRSSTHGFQGFTLIELVVVLAIGALLLGAIASVLGGVMDTTRKVLFDSTEQDDVAVAQRIVRTLLKAAIPPTARDGASKFEGKSDEVAFRAVPPESLFPFGELRFRLYVAAETSGGKSLFLDAVSDPLLSNELGIRLERYRLLGNVKRIGFQYFDNDGPERVARAGWTDQSRLPALVQMIVDREGDRSQLSLSLAPRRSVNGRCRYDQIALTCRG